MAVLSELRKKSTLDKSDSEMLCNTHTKSKYKEVIKKLQREAVVELTVGELYLPLTLSVFVTGKSICPLWGCGTGVWMHGRQIL